MAGIIIAFLVGFLIQEGLQVVVRNNDEPFSFQYYFSKPKNLIQIAVNLLIGVVLMFAAVEVLNIQGFSYPWLLAALIGLSVSAVVKLAIRVFERLIVTEDGTP